MRVPQEMAPLSRQRSDVERHDRRTGGEITRWSGWNSVSLYGDPRSRAFSQCFSTNPTIIWEQGTEAAPCNAYTKAEIHLQMRSGPTSANELSPDDPAFASLSPPMPGGTVLQKRAYALHGMPAVLCA
jgi:hypothetical protein